MRILARLLLLFALANLVPIAAYSTPTASLPSAVAAALTQPLPEPESVPVVQPPPDPKLPVLTFDLLANPATVTVGMTMTVRLTLTNHAAYPASGVAITLPLPDGVKLLETAKPVTSALPPQPASTIVEPASLGTPALLLPATEQKPVPIPPDDVTVTGSKEIAPAPLPVFDTEAIPSGPPPQVSLLGPDRSQDQPLPVQVVPPLGVSPFVGPAFDGGRDPAWTLDVLPAQSATVVTATLEIAALPLDGAFVFAANATAVEQPNALSAVGGVLAVVDHEPAADAAFAPGRATTLQSTDGRVTVTFPASAQKEPLTLRALRLRDVADDANIVGRGIPSGAVFGKPALDPFILLATDAAGAKVDRFDTPITIAVSYTDAQLRARGLIEDQLTLAYFDETEQHWVPVETAVDQQTHTARAQVRHFSPWTLTDGSSPSSLYVPSLQGFQVSELTGAASYSLPISVPSGAAGHAPNLSLSYSSGAQDGPGGWRPQSQAGWVGRGWSLSAGGSVARVRNPVDPSWDHYTFSFGGKSYDMVRGEQFAGSAGDLYEPYWTWVAADEGDFLKVRARPPVGSSTGYPLFWVAWPKDGTRYEFTQPMRTAEKVLVPNNPSAETDGDYWYQWLLTRSVDPSGNKIEYVYNIQSFQRGAIVVDPTSFLAEIRWGYDTMGTDSYWGHPQAGGTPRYRALFSVADRNITGTTPEYTAGVDVNWEYQTTSPLGNNLGTAFKDSTAHERWRLDMITVQSQRAAAWETISEYRLTYAAAAASIQSDNTAGQKQLTLTNFQRFDKNGYLGGSGTAVPATTFTYGTTVGTWPFYAPSWNRLITATNGQGGKVTYSYANTFEGLSAPSPIGLDYYNYKRVTQIVREDTSGNTYSRSLLTTYAYTNPALNSFQAQPSGYSTSAKAWYARYVAGDATGEGRLWQLARQQYKEFRGHETVTTRVYDGPTTAAALLQATTTTFRQGSANCTPTLSGNFINESDTCWQSMRRSELWKGRPKQVQVFNGAGGLMQQTDYIYDYSGLLPYYGDVQSLYKPSGLWPAFTPTRIERVGYAEGGSSLLYGTTTAYCYDAGWAQSNHQLGNRTHVIVYNQLMDLPFLTTVGQPLLDPATHLTNCDFPTTSVLPTRITRTAYGLNDNEAAGIYYADRALQQATYFPTSTTTSQLVTLSESFYDGNLTFGTIGALGRQTLTRAYRNTTGSPFESQDTGSGYDTWGNRTTTTSYATWGTRTYPSYSTPSGGSTTTIGFDTTFHALPVSQTNPLSQVEQADYDKRMGTLIEVVGPNAALSTVDCAAASFSIALTQEVTCATYDGFGRMVKLIKPGDSSSAATVEATYYDFSTPFLYIFVQKVTTASGDTRHEVLQFYDGLGRKVQEKREDVGWGTSMVVTDTRYDALSRVTATSQPRLDTNVWSSYLPQPAAGTSLYRQTATTYDGLGRTLLMTAPDSSVAENVYGSSSIGATTAQYDANDHKTVRHTDPLGRLLRVEEFSGSTNPYSIYATTTYSYDRLDRLVTVADQLSNTTNLYYNALGHKITMSDPDMGTWNYYYNAKGNLVTQTDARGINTDFYYDALNRLITTLFSNGNPARNFTYDVGTNGKGRRTSTCVGTLGSCSIEQNSAYDGRGRQTSASQTIGGTTLTFGSAYDSADRLTTQTYPDGEVVTTAYDSGGRAKSLCTSLGGCYVNSASTTYNPLDQPLTRQTGNGVTTTWAYNSPLSQLQRLTVPGVFDRSYTYDPVGNIDTIRNFTGNQTQNFDYDHRDRLTHAWTVVGTAQAPANRSQWQAFGPPAPVAAPQANTAPPAAPAALVFDEAAPLLAANEPLPLVAGGGTGGGSLDRSGSSAESLYLRHLTQQAARMIAAPVAPVRQLANLIVQDTFTRTVSNGWGSATMGGAYAAPASNAADYAVNGTLGRFTITAANTNRELLLNGAGSTTAQDIDIAARMAASILPVGTGAEVRFAVIGRQTTAGNQYRGVVRLLADGSVKLQVQTLIGGTEAWIASGTTVSGLTVTAGSFIRVRVQMTGVSPTTIKMRAWADGGSEPSTWLVTQTDSTAAMQAAGNVGLRTHLTSENTSLPITASWDDWVVTTSDSVGPTPTPTPTPIPGGGATIVSDSYTRTTSNGWGTATSIGGTYAAPASSAADYAVTGGTGQFTIPTNNTARELALTGAGTTTVRDADVRVRMAANALPTGTGGEVSFSTLVRYITSNDSYRGRVRLLADGSVKLQAEKEVAGTTSTIGTAATVSGLTVAANSFIWVRVVVTGINPTTIQLRAWADGSSEPTTWAVTQTDSESVLQATGNVGLRGFLNSSVTNAPMVTKFDDWLVTDLAAGAPTPTPTNTPVVPPTNTPTPTPNPAVVAPPSYDDSFSYDAIGNLTSKDGVSQQYGANNNGTGVRPHAARIVGGATYTYDNDGNLLTGGGRTLTWNAANQPSQIISGGITELYEYDADGSRVKRTVNPSAITTIYAFGRYEKEGTVTRKYYTFGGQPIAVRDSALGLSYLYGDHLGSVSASTNTTGILTSMQHFDAWGKKLAGNVSQTKRSFTGQYLDDTGLLFYNARYYDPGIGRFVSADTIVPGGGSLTVAPNDATAVTAWGTAGAAANPQQLNRYSYVLNNPLKSTDPTGHCFGVLAGVDTLACIGIGVLIVAATAVIAASAQSDANLGDVDWSDWSVPGLPAVTEPATPAVQAPETPADANVASSRSTNKLKPDPNASGAHSTVKRNPTTGEVEHYETWLPSPYNPSGYESEKRYDAQGVPHYNKDTQTDVATPHVHDQNTPGGVRPPNPDEIPTARGPK